MSELNMVVIPQKTENSEVLLNEPFFTQRIRENYLYFTLLSLGFGLFFTFCLYKNPSGITFPVFVSGSLLCLHLALKKLQVQWKKNSLFYLPVLLFIGINTCLTDNAFFHTCNKLALLLLTGVFMIHQFYQDDLWNFGRYCKNFLHCIFTSISCLPLPVSHFSSFQKSKTGKNSQLKYVALGVLMAIPLLCVILALLMRSDAAFSHLAISVFQHLTVTSSWFKIALMVVFSYIFFYGCICGVSRLNLSCENTDSRKWAVSLGITILLLLTLLYLTFCSVQVIVIFSQGTSILPANYTYAQYARQGFFELLYVSIINLVIVFISLTKFQTHPGLNVILSIFCGCTFFLIGSSAYRMLLYIQEYHLTFLRILVLWFLCLLSLLILGVIITIYKRSFPLFHYCVVVITALYLGFLCMQPDALIMKYNLAHQATFTLDDICYYTNLSADAAPYIAQIQPERIEAQNTDTALETLICYFRNLNKEPDIRSFNFSRAQAAQTAEEYLKGDTKVKS